MTESYLSALGHLSEIVINPTPNCNLRCMYCYDRFRKQRDVRTRISTDPRVFDGIDRMLDFIETTEIGVSFIGGEALLMGIEYFEAFEERFAHITHKNVYIQSNLCMLTDEQCVFFKSHNYKLGVSFDGVPAVHNTTRDGSYSDTMAGIYKAIDAGIFSLLTCTVTDLTAKYAEETFELFALMGVPLRFNAGTAIINGQRVTTPKLYMQTMQKIAELWFDFGRPFRWYRMQKVIEHIKSRKWCNVSRPRISSCMAGSINIEHDGRVNICAACAHDDSFILGNIIHDHPAKILLHKNRIGFFRHTVQSRSHCKHCIFRFICIGTCFANANTMNTERDPYCAGGAPMYKSVLNRLGITLSEYKAMIPA